MSQSSVLFGEGGRGRGGMGAELAKKNVLKKHPAENGVCAKDQTTALPIPKRIRLPLSPFRRGSDYRSPHSEEDQANVLPIVRENQTTSVPIPEIILQFSPFDDSAEVRHITLGPFHTGPDHNSLCSTEEQTITLSAFHSGSDHNPIRVPLRIRS